MNSADLAYSLDMHEMRDSKWPPLFCRPETALTMLKTTTACMSFFMVPRQCPGREVARIQTRLFITMLLWSLHMNLYKGDKLWNYEKDTVVYGMWVKPELRVRLLPVKRG